MPTISACLPDSVQSTSWEMSFSGQEVLTMEEYNARKYRPALVRFNPISGKKSFLCFHYQYTRMLLFFTP